MLMVLPPDWAASTTCESLVQHYKDISERIPVMLVTNLFLRRSDELGLDVVRTLLEEEVDGIMAVKDDVCGDFGRKLAAMCHDEWAVFPGGQKRYHLEMGVDQCTGYMSTYLKFKPEVSHRYWQAIQEKRIDGRTGHRPRLRRAVLRPDLRHARQALMPVCTRHSSCSACARDGVVARTSLRAAVRWTSSVHSSPSVVCCSNRYDRYSRYNAVMNPA